MDTVLRLAWALPLVLAVGVVTLLMLRPLLAQSGPATRPVERMSVRESLPLSDDTRVHLIEVDGKTYLVVESTRQAVLQPAQLQSGVAPHASSRSASDWIQRLRRAQPQ
jgi:flagellar biogenesis protein FliO